jgi:PAB-dependent poly(A)-specific ribonuclease subunit 3
MFFVLVFFWVGFQRLRINGVGIFDVLAFDGGKNVPHQQQEDVLALGKLLLCLACRSQSALQDVEASLEFLQTNFSPDFEQFVLACLNRLDLPSPPSPSPASPASSSVNPSCSSASFSPSSGTSSSLSFSSSGLGSGKAVLNIPTVDELCVMCMPRIMRDMEYLQGYADGLEGELAKEVENGRLFRLAAKMGFINERPE